MKFKIIFLIFFNIALTLADGDPKETLEVASQDIPPYYYTNRNGQIEGFFFQVIKDVCDISKINCHFKVYPFRRVQQYLKQGEVHICAPMGFSEERAIDMDFSNVIYSSGYEFFGKKSYISNISNLEDISANIGVHSPSSTHNALIKTMKQYKLKLRVKEETDVEMVFDKLKKGRYDLVFMNKDISKKWASENNSFPDEFISFKKYLYPIDYNIAYTKANLIPEQKKLLELFQKNLKSYLKSSKFKKHLEKL